ncbi:zinc finger protein SHOOT GRAVITROPISM 5-like [Lolium rigidum]|uniref:zinc finger protein SHOOT GRAVITROPISM 5-like n=1 Tax=Lolium rigidum TaxID=89674 RepID=UPI001F5C2A3B|nr:zinc finger protein SHOOT GRAVITROPISM 5-like [Lolium rigidum]
MGCCAPTTVPAADEETPFAGLQISTPSSASARKRKNRPAGTPDPEAEVVSLSPRTLMDSSRYACDICGKMFRREQNLVFHRRGHDMPWTLKKLDAAAPPRRKRRDEAAASRKKRAFVCPEPSCLHHHPSHALADHCGIKKHFLRKHGGHRQWACARCSKAYAVLNDYKAHVKSCGGHSGGPIFTRYALC